MILFPHLSEKLGLQLCPPHAWVIYYIWGLQLSPPMPGLFTILSVVAGYYFRYKDCFQDNDEQSLMSDAANSPL